MRMGCGREREQGDVGRAWVGRGREVRVGGEIEVLVGAEANGETTT